MSNYTQLTNFATKDNLASGNANKIVKGAEINAEFVAIETAVNSKADIASPTFTGTPAAPTAGSSTNTTQLATTAFVQTAVGALVTIPSGMLAPFAGTSAPTGWFLCDGQAVSRSTYANLFAVIGTTYGAGDGNASSGTTFNVPDLRGRTIAGQDDMGGAAASRLTGDNGATTATASANGSFTSTTNILVDGNSGTIVLGMKVTGTGISGEVTVIKINSQTDIVLSANVTIANDTALTFAFDGAVLGSAGGKNTHLLTSGESGLPGHNHQLNESPHNHDTSLDTQDTDASGNSGIQRTGGSSNINTGTATTGITIDAVPAADASSAHNIIQPTLVLNYIIKQ
jgi:microcystin-dependent protein